MNILDKLADLSRERAKREQETVSAEELREQAKALGKGNGEAFLSALKKPGISFICEIKKASPSKGLISPDFPYLKIAAAYEQAQLDQAREMGANAALLIVSLMDERTLAAYLEHCEELGIAALVETHDEEEIRTAVSAGAKIIGVNNRNLKDFSVDFGNAARLRDRIPPECIYVAESGVRTPEDVQRLRQIGADAALIGETLMRAEDPAETLKSLRRQ